MSLQEMNEQLNEWFEQMKEYFSNLNEYEKYAWGAEVLGVALVVTGIVLLL